jgi:hypothetical protein
MVKDHSPKCFSIYVEGSILLDSKSQNQSVTLAEDVWRIQSAYRTCPHAKLSMTARDKALEDETIRQFRRLGILSQRPRSYGPISGNSLYLCFRAMITSNSE